MGESSLITHHQITMFHNSLSPLFGTLVTDKQQAAAETGAHSTELVTASQGEAKLKRQSGGFPGPSLPFSVPHLHRGRTRRAVEQGELSKALA